MNITTRTTIVSNVQLDDTIPVWLLEEEGFKSMPKTWKCWRRNFGQSIPDPRSRNAEGPTTDWWQLRRILYYSVAVCYNQTFHCGSYSWDVYLAQQFGLPPMSCQLLTFFTRVSMLPEVKILKE